MFDCNLLVKIKKNITVYLPVFTLISKPIKGNVPVGLHDESMNSTGEVTPP